MTPKEYLSQYRDSLVRTNQLTAHLEQLREVSDGLSAEHGRHARLDESVAKLVDAQQETSAEIDRLVQLRAEISGVIDSIQDDTLHYILYSKYINGEPFEQIAVDLHYHYVSVCRLHGAALKRIKDVIDC